MLQCILSAGGEGGGASTGVPQEVPGQPRELDHNRASYYVAVLIGVLVVREVVQALVSIKRYLASQEYCIIIELPILLQC
jgi:hypothetical protein